jgi:hypothetical protein
MYAEFLVKKVALGQVYVQTLRFSPVSFIPAGLHTQYFVHLCNFSKNSVVIKKHFSFYRYIRNYPSFLKPVSFIYNLRIRNAMLTKKPRNMRRCA